MKVEILPRQMGKTTRLIKWLLEDNSRIIITFSEHEADRIKRYYFRSDGVFRPKIKKSDFKRILSMQEYMEKKTMGYKKPLNIGIDNADIILQNIFWDRIEKITMTENN